MENNVIDNNTSVRSKKEKSKFFCDKIPRGTRFHFNCIMFEHLYLNCGKKNKGND
jgi:hypothetical protein